MTAGAALVDALGQVAHLGHAVADFLAKQHAAAAGLGALADHDLDRVAAAQVIGVHAVARGQILIDQLVGMAALFRGHAAVACGGRGASQVAPRPNASLAGPDSAPKDMPAMVIGISSSIGFLA